MPTHFYGASAPRAKLTFLKYGKPAKKLSICSHTVLRSPPTTDHTVLPACTILNFLVLHAQLYASA